MRDIKRLPCKRPAIEQPLSKAGGIKAEQGHQTHLLTTYLHVDVTVSLPQCFKAALYPLADSCPARMNLQIVGLYAAAHSSRALGNMVQHPTQIRSLQMYAITPSLTGRKQYEPEVTTGFLVHVTLFTSKQRKPNKKMNGKLRGVCVMPTNII